MSDTKEAVERMALSADELAKLAVDFGVDGQVLLAAAEMEGHQPWNPEWLWYDHDSGGLSFGRWPKDAKAAAYVRLGLALKTIATLLAQRDAADRAGRERGVREERAAIIRELELHLQFTGPRGRATPGERAWNSVIEVCIQAVQARNPAPALLAPAAIEEGAKK